MTGMTFEDRMVATGLSPKVEDMAKIRMMVEDLDRAASFVRGHRPYGDEPLSALRLKKASE